MPRIRTKPELPCPVCGARMKLVQPREDQDWPSFWSCVNWPDCKGTRKVIYRGEEDLNFWERDTEYKWVKR